jgi:hypothetical protein
MKNFSKTVLTIFVLTCVSYFASAQTLKERIDEAKVVKIYFNNTPIEHSPNTESSVASNVPGTGCEKFGETTPLPTEYTDAVNGLLDLFNTGFKTTAFVAGDFSSIAKKESGMLKGQPDWISLGESLMFYVYTYGNYNVKMGSEGKVNSMSIKSYLIIYGIKKGKINIVTQKEISKAWSEVINTQKCDDYAYFIEHFEANSLAEPFNTMLIEKTNALIAKDMKKYEKAMKKKK